MLQSHLLEVLALVAMEQPPRLNEVELRSNAAQVLRATHVWDDDPVASSRRARYTAGKVGDRSLPSYADEPGVDPALQDRDARPGDGRDRHRPLAGRAVRAALGQGARREDHPGAGAHASGAGDPRLRGRPGARLDHARRQVGRGGAGRDDERQRRPVHPRAQHARREEGARATCFRTARCCAASWTATRCCPCAPTWRRSAGASSSRCSRPGGRTRSRSRSTRRALWARRAGSSAAAPPPAGRCRRRPLGLTRLRAEVLVAALVRLLRRGRRPALLLLRDLRLLALRLAADVGQPVLRPRSAAAIASAARTSARCDSACGMLPIWRFRGGSYSSLSSPTSLTSVDEPLHQRARLGDEAGCGVLLHEPERAGEERMLGARQPVDARLGR